MARGYRRDGRPSERLEREALKLAEQAEVVLLYLGLPECFESEGLDRTHLSLPDNQIRFLERVGEVNSNLVVVLAGGGVLEMPWLEVCRALLHGYLGGQAGAGAAADLLTGRVGSLWPSGGEHSLSSSGYSQLPLFSRAGAYSGIPGGAVCGLPVLPDCE